jgi:hypothetical protein
MNRRPLRTRRDDTGLGPCPVGARLPRAPTLPLEESDQYLVDRIRLLDRTDMTSARDDLQLRVGNSPCDALGFADRRGDIFLADDHQRGDPMRSS